MAIDQIGGGSNYTPQVESTRVAAENTAKVKMDAKPSENEAKAVQDKVEIRQSINTKQIEETSRVKDNVQAQDMKDKVKTQMESNPYQAMYAQGNNMTASRVANLL